MGLRNAEIGVVLGVTGHPRSLKPYPFDRAYMTSYSTLIETILYRFRVIASFLSNVANFNSPCILAFVTQ